MLRVASKQVIIWPTPTRWLSFFDLDSPDQQSSVHKRIEKIVKRNPCWSYKLVSQPKLEMLSPVEENILVFDNCKAA